MRWLSHIAVALALFLLISLWLNFPAGPVLSPNFLLLAISCALSALVPDLDHEGSKGTHILFPLLCLGAIVLAAGFTLSNISPGALMNFALYSLAGIGTLFIIAKVLRPRHRGITHSFFALAVFAVAALLISRDFAFTFSCFLGYLSHLLADFELKLT